MMKNILDDKLLHATRQIKDLFDEKYKIAVGEISKLPPDQADKKKKLIEILSKTKSVSGNSVDMVQDVIKDLKKVMNDGSKS